MELNNHESLQYEKDYINFLRGVAIFLMLWGHAIQHASNGEIDYFEDSAFKLIYSFHMPLFMMISGYLFRGTAQKLELLDLLKHKTQQIFVPLMTCTIINYYATTGVRTIIRGGDWKALLSGNWIAQLSTLWFLWSVLVTSIVFGVAIKASAATYKQVIIALVGWVVIVPLFPCAAETFFLYPYFVFGYIMSGCKLSFEKLTKGSIGVLLMSLAVFIPMFCNYEKRHYIYTTGILGNGYPFLNHIGIDVFRWLIGFAGSVSVILLCVLIYKALHMKRMVKPIFSGAKELGKYSLEVYAFSAAFLSGYLPLLSRKLLIGAAGFKINESIGVYDWLLTPLIAVGYAIVLCALSKLLYKMQVGKYIFGNRNIKAKTQTGER